MTHSLISKVSSSEDEKYEISVIEIDYDLINISISYTNFLNEMQSNETCLNLNKKELHSFIGTLLHVQAKMKGGN